MMQFFSFSFIHFLYIYFDHSNSSTNELSGLAYFKLRELSAVRRTQHITNYYNSYIVNNNTNLPTAHSTNIILNNISSAPTRR